MGKRNIATTRKDSSAREISAHQNIRKENDEILDDSTQTENFDNTAESVLLPTVTIKEYLYAEDERCSRPESRNSISSAKSDPTFLTIPGMHNSKEKRPKSADAYKRKSDNSLCRKGISNLRRTSSDRIINDNVSTECACTCVPREERKCELSGSQLVSFYGLWRNKKQKTLGKKLEIPSFMKRRTEYRQCGCKTREYEKQCSKEKLTTCPCHGI